MWGAREEVTNEKPRLRKCGLLVVCPYGLYVTYVGGKGGSNKRKNHVKESAVFSWFAHTGRLCHLCGGKGGSNKRKNHVLKSVVFSWFAYTGLYVTYLGGKGGSKTNGKTTF